MDSKNKGIIFDIKRFAIHDGAGIRTTVFIKGCPLRCPWCHNPEGRKREIELGWFSSLCVRCASCTAACSQNALTLENDKINIDKNACTLNADCIKACPTGAIKFDGREATAEEVYAEIIKDKVFYFEKGGITLSGGDPTMQADFSLSILELCKANGVNTAIETCLYADEAVIMRFVPLVDQFFVDIKIFDDEKHKAVVGVSNKKILSNFRALCKAGAKICVRIPLIPGYTDDDENIRDVSEFVHKTNKNVDIELLNYNPLAANKFDTLNEKYLVGKGTQPLSEELIRVKRKIVSDIMEE